MTTVVKNTPQAWDERALRETPWDAGLWSHAGQTTRFFAIRKRLVFSADDTVLDFGCGTGGFCELLPESVVYYAYDWSEEMRARVRREHERAWVLDELDDDMTFDHVVAIGPFNLRDSWSHAQTWDKLEELWARTRKTLIVSLYRAEPSPSMLTYRLDQVANFVSGLDCSSYAIDTTHLPNDLVLELRR